MHKNKVGVLIMRAQGYHDQHHEHIVRAASENDTIVLVLGSVNARVSQKNPFNFEQRVEMIKANTLKDKRLDGKNIVAVGAHNHPNNFIWRDNVISLVEQLTGNNNDITLYGSNKDSSSFYLGLFPDWKQSLTEVAHPIDATQIRELYFKGCQSVHFLRDHPHVSEHTIKAMMEFKFNPDLQDEYDHYQRETELLKSYKYPTCLNISCGDSVVLVNGKVLMVRRKHAPGKGCPALPGGHKESNETYVQAAIRELIEEAQIGVPEDILYDNIVGSLVFDEPNRSEGPLTRITVGVLIDLSHLYDGDDKPSVFANDDAVEVMWVDAEEAVVMDGVYDDHSTIIYELLTTFL